MRLQLLVLLTVGLRWSEAAPEARPEALPEAQPEALPEALPEAAPDANPEALPAAEADPEAAAQMIYSGTPMGMSYSAPVVADYSTSVIGGGAVSGVNNCGLVNECCGLADKGCCVGGQKCYTKYERVCRNQNQPVCKTMVQRACVNHPIKYCRTVSTPTFFNVPTYKCKKTRERKCWTYTKQECRAVQSTYIHNVTWSEQEAVNMPERTEEKCYNVNTCKIVDDTQPVQRQVPQQKCENVPMPRRVCRSVPVASPPVEKKNVVWETTYQQQCYSVPRTKCTTVGCSYGGCPAPAQTCAVGGYQTQSVCAQPVGASACVGDICQPGVGMTGVGLTGVGMTGVGLTGVGLTGGAVAGSALCQQVETPVCQAGPVACTAGPQQCCSTVMEQVCQQVPTRVPRTVTTMEAGVPQFQQVCDTVTEYKQDCRTVMITTTVNLPTKRCETAQERKCVTIRVPEVEIKDSVRSESLRYPFNNCTIEEVEDKHCADVDSGVSCNLEQERRVVTIRRSVCDQERQQQFCHEVPSSSCSNVGGQVCEMVPREVCQNTCATTASCNTCSEFVSGGGYGICNTDTCNNFYPSSAGLVTVDGGEMLSGGGLSYAGGSYTSGSYATGGYVSGSYAADGYATNGYVASSYAVPYNLSSPVVVA